MNQFVHRLLSILLIFVLGLSPLQAVNADLSVPVDQTNMPCHMASDSMPTSEPFLQLEEGCDMCSTGIDCNNSCGHCISVAIALLQDTTTLSNSKTPIELIQLVQQVIDHQLPGLFRPPRL